MSSNINSYKPIVCFVDNEDDIEKKIQSTVKTLTSLEGSREIKNEDNKNDERFLTDAIVVAVAAVGSIFFPSIGGSLLSAVVMSAVSSKKAKKLETRDNTNKEKQIKSQDKMVKALIKESDLIKEWKNKVEIIPFSSIPSELKFPPGHPIPNKLYREHPLSSKKQHYIPAESYYPILLDERESELLQILCDLGATKIEIYEEETQDKNANIESKAGITGVGGLEGKISNKEQQANTNRREFTYIGKPWKPQLQFDKTKYSWLDYEPTWESIVYGRLVNGQLTATIELTTDISHEITAGLSIAEGILENFGSINTSFLSSKSILIKRKFIIEFAGKEDTKPTQGKTK